MGDHPHISYRKESRADYGTIAIPPQGSISNDQLSLGCELRAADALETIAKTLPEIAGNLGAIRWNIERIANRPSLEKRQISRLKLTVKRQKEEIAELKKKAVRV